MKKTFIFYLSALIAVFLSSSIFAEVNNGGLGINVHLGLGGGNSVYAIGGDNASNSQIGVGQGGGYDLGAAISVGPASFYSFAAELNVSGASLGDLEWTDTEDGNDLTYKQYGEGAMAFVDLRLGLRLFLEPGDMGYTYFYGGLKSFSADYKMTKVRIKDNDTGLTSEGVALQDTGAAGAGWVVGFKDFSTLNFGLGSIVTTLSFWYFECNMDEKTEMGNTIKIENSTTKGFGGEFGVGYAIEPMGLAITLSWRGEVVYNEHNEVGSTVDEGFGAGYGMFLLGATFEL
ncbi:MAG: hypothetical protein JW982_12620 [Spirochaetes bacterium]|nr:hypothetical protein [Spirochaetota bacterium]